MSSFVNLSHGAGGEESYQLIAELRKLITLKGSWKNTDDDSAVLKYGNKYLVFTTDAFIIDPLFFPGGEIGSISITGTLNDLTVMGARPMGIALSMVIEEGFSKKDLTRILKSIARVSEKVNVPIVTGDTKVTEKGKIDKIEITTSGIGMASQIVSDTGAKPGDVVISSGDLGEHGVALLAYRFDYQTNVKSDCYAFVNEFLEVSKYLTSAKDPTRGGLAANLNEISRKSKVKIILDEKNLPYKKEVSSLADLLGIDIFSLPSEGRFIATCSKKAASKVLTELKKHNRHAKIIGRIEKGIGVYLETKLKTKRIIEMPRGKIIPRIC